MEGVLDEGAQRRVMERPALGEERQGRRDAQGADRVPHPDERDLGIRMRVAGTERGRRLLARLVLGLAAPVQLVGVFDHPAVLAPQDPAVAHEPAQATRGERAAAEAEEEQLVAGLVVIDDPRVALPHVAREPDAERAAADALPRARADPGLVHDDLGHGRVRRLVDGFSELADVRHGGLVRAVPRPVAEDHQAFLWWSLLPLPPCAQLPPACRVWCDGKDRQGGHMGRLRTAVIATCALAVLVPTTASAKGKNPYTAKGLCGSSFKVIERKPLRAVSPLDGKNHLLATAVLMYSGATGENCAVLLKRRRIDKPDNLNITLITRPRSDANSDGDGGLDLGYFAGPVKVYAPHKKIQWWGGTMQKQRKFHTTVTLNSGFRSGWVHGG